MARVKNGAVTKARHKKVLKAAKGYTGSKHRLYKTAKEQLMKSRKYAYRDRKNRKRDFRKLWITRINAACRMNEISYSKFIDGLNKAGIEINRKMLSELAIDNAASFAELVKIAKDANEGKAPKKAEVKAETKVEAKTEKAPAKKENQDLSKLTVAELKEMAKKKKIENYTSMKKAELVDILSK